MLREGQPITLRAKIFDTLCVLVEAHGRLVDKDELINRVWPDAVVEEGNLAHNISALRKTLGEPATGQKYIETVPGRGYRFAADRPRDPAPRIWTLARDPSSLCQTGCRASCPTSGRAAISLIAALNARCGEHARWSSLAAKRVSARPPSSTPSLRRRGERPRLWFGYGQCLDHRGPGEAYMPVLEALSRMCREAAGEDLIKFLARCAPTWLVQMPWLLSGNELDGLQQSSTRCDAGPNASRDGRVCRDPDHR